MSFKDKVVIVTGASSGIRAAIAEAFSAEGAKVVIVGRNENKLNAVATRCANSLVLRADVKVEDNIRRIVDETVEKFGRIDILINNAGTSAGASLLKGDILASYETVMNVNLRAVVYLTNLAAPHIVKTKGNIINISAILATIPTLAPEIIMYSVSKAAVNHFTHCSASELAPLGVRVNTISPGPTETSFLENTGFPGTWDIYAKATALNRVSQAIEIADLALFLASDKAKGITGANYVCDNGLAVKR